MYDLGGFEAFIPREDIGVSCGLRRMGITVFETSFLLVLPQLLTIKKKEDIGLQFHFKLVVL